MCCWCEAPKYRLLSGYEYHHDTMTSLTAEIDYLVLVNREYFITTNGLLIYQDKLGDSVIKHI